jgi:hypothetical protein
MAVYLTTPYPDRGYCHRIRFASCIHACFLSLSLSSFFLQNALWIRNGQICNTRTKNEQLHQVSSPSSFLPLPQFLSTSLCQSNSEKFGSCVSVWRILGVWFSSEIIRCLGTRREWSNITVFNRCSTVHFDKYEIFLVQQMHYLLKHKILQFVFRRLNVHFSAPTCFGPLGPSSGSIHQSLAKVTKITVF